MIFNNDVLSSVAKELAAIPESGVAKEQVRDMILDQITESAAVLGRLIFESALFNGLVVEREGRIYPGPRHQELVGKGELPDLISLLEQLAGN